MPTAIAAAATIAASWASAAAAAAATALGFSAATAATVSIYAAQLAYALVANGLPMLVSMGLGAIAQAQMPDPETGKLTRKQARPLRTFAVGGLSRFNGAYMLRESKGRKFAGVLAFCDDWLARVDGVYLNDDKVTLEDGWVQGMAGERYGTGDLVRLEYRLGAPTETHYGFLTPDFGGLWPVTARGDGIASIGWLAEHRSTESFSRHFPNGEIIPTLVGAPRCYDWRDETQDRNNPASWKECWNPVVWLVHVEWFRHGRSWARCIAPVLDQLTPEADWCDEEIERAEGVTEPRYRVAFNYPSNLHPASVRNTLLASMDGWMSIDGRGRLVIKAGRYVEPTFVLTGQHIKGFSWKAFQTDEEAINHLVVSYVSAEHDYTEVEAGIVQDEADIEARGEERSETLPLTGVPSAHQAMHLGKRKMSRLGAERRGMVRSTIYGLNGLGQRFIRIQNPVMKTMADVVVEVLNVEIDFMRSEVVFDIILADPTIDEDETVTVVPPPVVTPEPYSPGRGDPALPPVSRDETFPTQSDVGEISVLSFSALTTGGKTVNLPATTIAGLAHDTTYGVFWREDVGYEVEAAPAQAHMQSGSWLFIGWQTTPAADGTWSAAATPGGFGGTGPAVEPLDAADRLAAGLQDGTIRPAVAETFTDAGALATLDQVDTAEIKTQAVNGPAWAVVATPVNITASMGTMCSVGATTGGEVVRICASAYLSGVSSTVFSISAQISIDGDVVWPASGIGQTVAIGPQVAPGTFQLAQVAVIPTLLTALPAGAHVIALQMVQSGATSTPIAQDIQLSVERLKDVR